MNVNVCALASRSQQSRLVVTEILRRAEAHERAVCIEKWIQVAEVCRLLRNLNGVLEVCAALMNSAVFRLKLSWERVSKQVRLRARAALTCNLPIHTSIHSTTSIQVCHT